MKINIDNTRGFKAILVFYLISIVLGNLLVYWLGPPGILITSFVFIPFDFIIRCYIHELYSGKKLYLTLFGIVLTGGSITFFCNYHAINIAIGSVAGFTSATIAGSIIYQIFKSRAAILKVNSSDIIALIVDSIVFQTIAFGHINKDIVAGQIAIKLLGGFAWYYFLVHKFDMVNRIKAHDFKLEITKNWSDAVGIHLRESNMRCAYDGKEYVVCLEHYLRSETCIARIKCLNFPELTDKRRPWIMLMESKYKASETAKAMDEAHRLASAYIKDKQLREMSDEIITP